MGALVDQFVVSISAADDLFNTEFACQTGLVTRNAVVWPGKQKTVSRPPVTMKEVISSSTNQMKRTLPVTGMVRSVWFVALLMTSFIGTGGLLAVFCLPGQTTAFLYPEAFPWLSVYPLVHHFLVRVSVFLT